MIIGIENNETKYERANNSDRIKKFFHNYMVTHYIKFSIKGGDNMININLEIASALKEIIKLLDKNQAKKEWEIEKIKQEQIEKSNLKYVLEENQKEAEKWSKMWE